MDFSDLEKAVYGNHNLEEDDDLMAELMALEQETKAEQRAKVARAAPPAPAPVRQIPTATSAPASRKPQVGGGMHLGIDPSLLAAALADPVEDVEVEEDDDLLAELGEMIGEQAPKPNSSHSVPTAQAATAQPSTGSDSVLSHLVELKGVYDKMKSASEKDGNDSKTRRLARQIATLNELIVKAKKGLRVNPDDIPPAPVGWTPGSSTVQSTSSQNPPPVPQRQPPPAPTPVQPSQALQRSPQALPALPPRKESQSREPALNRTTTESSEQRRKAEFKEILIRRRNAYVANGKAAVAADDKAAAMQFVGISKMFDEALKMIDTASADDLDLSDVPASPQPYRKKIAPKTFLEGLQYRRDTYAEMVQKSKAAGEERKVRMYTRTLAEYDEAIKCARSGRPVDVTDLPALPNMPPLPAQIKGAGPAPASGSSGSVPRTPAPMGPPAGLKPSPTVGPLAPGEAGKTRNQTQLDFLLERQKQFRQAAIMAKKQNNNELAKDYLIKSKGFDRMIERARAGLPVSIANTPIPPQASASVASLQPRIVSAAAKSTTGVEGRGEQLTMLEKTLIEQVRIAESNRMRFTRLGDVGKVKLFESWAKTSQMDLMVVREVAKQGLKVPGFRTELRNIPTSDMFPDLAEDILELTISGCRDVPLPAGYEPNHAAIFVRYTFPYPAENVQPGKTKTINDTVSPVFNEKFMLQIGDRKSRGQRLVRVLKRVPLKLEVYQKGSFLRSDKLLGTCEYKLDVLESRAEIEESAPLKDGRKAVGGLISFKVRTREPLGETKVQIAQQKWLILLN